MTLTSRLVFSCFVSLVWGIGITAVAQQATTQTPDKTSQQSTQPSPATRPCVDEIRCLLDAIDPYLPEGEVSGEIDMFGSTSMDVLAHSWTHGFQKFHPGTKVIISAEGSETVIDRLAKNPSSIGMFSRPVTEEDLNRLKEVGLKNPVAVQVAREALGVFVHESNPMEVISYPQLVTLFCSEDPNAKVTWSVVGVTGDFADKPVHVIGRTETSGTRKFIRKYLFHKNSMRQYEQTMDTNGDVLRALSEDPQAIAIADFKTNMKSVRRLKLRDDTTVIEGDEHDVLVGRYPITRPLTLVFDLEGENETTAANRELIKFALAQTGQSNTILAGFFPFDPPTLRAEQSKLQKGPSQR
jgi:phosphate transport system substrate-binding protein